MRTNIVLDDKLVKEAIENNLKLLHNDKDFTELMRIEKNLVAY